MDTESTSPQGTSVRPYSTDDFNNLVYLHALRDAPDQFTIATDNVPEIGFVAEYNNYPVCMGFLRMVEGGYAQIDSLVTNPSFNSDIRHNGIVNVAERLITTAKSLGLSGIISYTADLNIIVRSEALGFKVLTHTVIALNLRS